MRELGREFSELAGEPVIMSMLHLNQPQDTQAIDWYRVAALEFILPQSIRAIVNIRRALRR